MIKPPPSKENKMFGICENTKNYNDFTQIGTLVMSKKMAKFICRRLNKENENINFNKYYPRYMLLETNDFHSYRGRPSRHVFKKYVGKTPPAELFT